MNRSNVDELLVDLYLRLNGYFTTGLIIHSPERGSAKTEIDRLAVRNLFHSQAERAISNSQFLELQPFKSELIICEVKSDVNSLAFNEALLKNTDSVSAALRWSGLIEPNDIELLTNSVLDLLGRCNDRDKSVNLGVEYRDMVVRALLCCPSENSINDGWVLDGEEIFGFIHQCLCPDQERESCSTRYNFQQWGYTVSDIVRYFKNESGGVPSALGLYAHMRCTESA